MNESYNKGFSLIEIILYISISGIILSGGVLFTRDIIHGKIKSNIQRHVSHNIRLASHRILYEIRNANGINTLSETALCLNMNESTRDPTKFELINEQIHIGYGGESCDQVTMYALTSSDLAVTSLTFTDTSSGTDSYNISFSLTIESTGTRSEWQVQKTLSSAAELRTN